MISLIFDWLSKNYSLLSYRIDDVFQDVTLGLTA